MMHAPLLCLVPLQEVIRILTLKGFILNFTDNTIEFNRLCGASLRIRTRPGL
jgi:hypothetical protein